MVPASAQMQGRAWDQVATCCSPNSGIAVSSTLRPCGGIGARACFAEAAGVAEVLAGCPIRGDLQAHVAVRRVAERSPGPMRGSPLLTDGRSVLPRPSVPP